MYPAYLWNTRFLALMEIRARLASQMVRSRKEPFFSIRLGNVWVDRTAILFEVTCRTWWENSPAKRCGIRYTGAPAADGR